MPAKFHKSPPIATTPAQGGECMVSRSERSDDSFFLSVGAPPALLVRSYCAIVAPSSLHSAWQWCCNIGGYDGGGGHDQIPSSAPVTVTVRSNHGPATYRRVVIFRPRQVQPISTTFSKLA